jgi:hypothetical protein
VGLAVELHLGPVVRMRALVEPGRIFFDLAGFVAVHRQEVARVGLDAGHQVPVPDAVAGTVQRQTPARFVVAQRVGGLLALGDVEHDTHPVHLGAVAAGNDHRTHLDPALRAVGAHDAKLLAQGLLRAGRLVEFSLHAQRVGRVHILAQPHAAGHHLLRRHAIDPAHAVAAEHQDTAPVGHHVDAVDHRRQVPRHFVQARLGTGEGLVVAPPVGDVLDRALVVQRAALGIAHDVGVLADPDRLARLVAIDLRLEAAHLTIALERGDELGAPPRIDVPLAADVMHGGDLLGLARIAVERHQRRVGAQLAAGGRGPVGPDRQEVEQGREVVLHGTGVIPRVGQCDP